MADERPIYTQYQEARIKLLELQNHQLDRIADALETLVAQWADKNP